MVEAGQARRRRAGALIPRRAERPSSGNVRRAKPWRSPEAEAVLIGKPADAANFRLAAEAALRGARPQSENKFKIELAKRCLVHALQTAANA